ncbi:hypothetical protein [Halorussus halophilus]|uniref:hypothetical protein n=1 Tax=Halorussus halophilus TaxID=2650975 RepID=UPI001CE48CAA|nr:hypothetical protein [Halorussus halophilus]
MADDSHDQVNRRKVLSAAGGIGFGSITGMFGSDLGSRETAEKFNSQTGVEEAFDVVGDDLLTTMSQSEHVDSGIVPSVSDFVPTSAEEYFEAEEGTLVTPMVKDGQATVRIEYSKDIPGGEVVFKLFPLLGKAQGLVVNANGISVFKSEDGTISEQNYDPKVEPQACTGSNCLQSEVCRWQPTRHEHTELYCCYQDGEIVDCCWGSIQYYGCVPDCDTNICADYCQGTCG